jgi:hydroxymethylglutaryl-CoA reductase (NADPH)
MSTSSSKALQLIELFSAIKSFDQILDEVRQKQTTLEDSDKIPDWNSWSQESRQKRIDFLREKSGLDLKALSGESPDPDPELLKGNIEQYIGMTRIPTGVIGPLQINGSLAQGDFFVPLATTEGALVASYNRGARATKLSGGIVSVCLTEGVQRAPVFKFISLSEVGHFMQWVLVQIDQFHSIVQATSRYAKLQDMRLNMEGNTVLLIFEYTTGEASGQNMVTICTNAICQYIIQNCPVKPQHWFIEGNYSGDKKATAVSFSTVRGKKVTAEALIPKDVLTNVLKTTAAKMAQYWQVSSVGSIQSGSIGIQGHYANGLTALFMATGQDVACVAEAFVGITRMEVMNEADLYLSVTLPSLMVGTVGGGTWLPGQRECLDLLGCSGPNSARKLAEICGATVLAGELSIAAAMASQDFASAHQALGRKK